ncbi:hypothetical protein [Neorhizobium sp. P12A]|uniref:DUF7940 domain-containing protein n=1 Tax=Neorhizobium sp. P12A TaxID=2268027 RepID=UPI001FEEAF2E|nr:hypothetical protein [Neorhizobium sp. P12A]
MQLIPDVRRVLSRAWSLVRARLLPDVASILRRAWSLRLMELAALADVIINVVPATADYLPWWLTLLLLVGAWAARLVAQPDKEQANANQ